MSKNIDNQIAEYLNWCQNVADYTDQTLESKKYILTHFASQIGIKCMSKLTNEIFNNWKNEVLLKGIKEKRYTVNTCNTKIKNLKAFVKWLRECGVCQVPAQTPYMTLIRQNEERIYTFYERDQIGKVLEVATIRGKAMISLLFESGMRLCEFQNIRLEDIDFDSKSIEVIGKGRKRARVFFTEETRHHLINYINEAGLMYGFLWASRRNNEMPYTKDALRNHMKRPFAKLGMEKFAPHQLRHSFATDLIESGATIYETQKLLRHSSSSTTEIYVHNLQNTLGDVYSRLKRQGIYHQDGLYWKYPEKFDRTKVFYKEKA